MTVLDRSWKNCLKMWKWITKNLPLAFLELSREEQEEIINKLKRQWVKENKFTNYIAQYCFFCEYDRNHKYDCSTCPARLVEPHFHCDDDLQSYRFDPLNFYIRMLELNIKRKEQE